MIVGPSSHFKENQGIDWQNTRLDINKIPEEVLSFGSIDLFEDRLGRKIGAPILAIKGKKPGPVLGITAAIHGNEINGIPIIHEIFHSLDPNELKGTIIGVPVINIPGYLNYKREFIDGKDLNRIMPGKARGTPSQEYAHSIFSRIAAYFDYHIDLHTASFGRINSHYIRADLTHPVVNELASLQHAQIIVHTKGPVGSFRSASVKSGHPAITIELGNPQVFQNKLTVEGIHSIENVMKYLKMMDGDIIQPRIPPVICKKSYWVRCFDGGILEVYPKLIEKIEEGSVIATLRDIYGRDDITYKSPEAGIIVGKNVNPVVSTGDRIIHLGVIGDPPPLSQP